MQSNIQCMDDRAAEGRKTPWRSAGKAACTILICAMHTVHSVLWTFITRYYHVECCYELYIVMNGELVSLWYQEHLVGNWAAQEIRSRKHLKEILKKMFENIQTSCSTSILQASNCLGHFCVQLVYRSSLWWKACFSCHPPLRAFWEEIVFDFKWNVSIGCILRYIYLLFKGVFLNRQF